MAQQSFKRWDCDHTDLASNQMKGVVSNWCWRLYGVFLNVPILSLHSWHSLHIKVGDLAVIIDSVKTRVCIITDLLTNTLGHKHDRFCIPERCVDAGELCKYLH